MAKKEVTEEKKVTKKSEREVRWEKFLETYAEQNPVKYAAKKARGEFDKIPESFQ